jgi:hypothetical protein
VLRRARAERLASRAQAQRADGSRGLLARRAWRRLMRAVDRGDWDAVEAVRRSWLPHQDNEGWMMRAQGGRSAFEAVRRSWLHHPDDAGWTALARWYAWYRSDLTAALLAAAVEPGRPAAEREAIGAFCARRGLVPAGGAERALFYGLTGQGAQRRAADPDGALLAVAYRGADHAVRSALREALAAAGDLTLARTLAVSARSSRAVPLTAEERRYLVGQLAARADWDGLWRLALDLPLADAVAATRSIPGGWRPRDEAGRQLLARLASSRPEAVTAVVDAAVTCINLDQHDKLRCDFSPDGSQVAVTTHWMAPARTRSGLPHHNHTTTVYALPSGRELDRLRGPFSVDLLDETTLICHYWKSGNVPAYRYVRYSPRRGSDKIRPGLFHKVPGGFIMQDFAGALLYGSTVPRSPLRPVVPSGLGQDPAGKWLRALGCEQVTGRLAVAVGHDDRALVVLNRDFEVIGRGDGLSGGVLDAEFCGPERLITISGSWFQTLPPWRVSSWRVGSSLSLEAEASTSTRGFPRFLPFANRIALATRADIGQPSDQSYQADSYLDPRTLAPADTPPEMRGAGQFWLSPSGDRLATRQSDTELEVRDLRQYGIGERLRRAMARLAPADLGAVRAAGAHHLSREPAEVTSLLQACLEYRFATDVAVGDRPAAAPDDITLADDDQS